MEQLLPIEITFLFSAPTETGTLSERLGYGPNDKLLIIHADDIGMSHSVNRATIRAFETGIVTCGSVMTPCPWFPEFADYCRRRPEIDVGIHLTLTSEWRFYRWGPVAGKDKVPSLLDDEGFLWRSTEEFREHAKPEEVQIELRAQIERALQFGLKPTHLDTHMGTAFVKPEFFEIYYNLGKEYNITPMLAKLTPQVKELLKSMGCELSEKMLKTLQSSTFPFIDRLVTEGGSGRTFEEKKEAYYTTLKNLRPGISEIIIHLGMDDEELNGIMSDALSRYNDYRVFTDPETRELIDKLCIRLIGWKDLAKTVGKEK